MRQYQRPEFRLGYVEPCIPTPSKKIPIGPQWLHELKHDGYRLIARRNSDRVRLFTRGGYDWTDRYPRIVGALDDMRVKSVTIDGEVVVCRPNGKPDFDKLHSRVFDRVAVMIAFDLIELNGKDWAAAPLEERKLRLAQLLRLSTDIHYNEHFDCDGDTLFKHACKLKLEGIVSKRRDYPYRSGPSKAWVKIKNPRSPAMLRVRDGTF